MSLLLVPATRENLQKSIERSVETSFAEKYLPHTLINEIIRFAGLEGIRCWAMTKNRLYIYDQIQNGDEVLLTEKNTGEFTYYGIVIGKTQNLAFGNALWPIVGKDPWEYVYFLANIKNIHVNKSSLVQMLGYANNFTVSGVTFVNEDRFIEFGTVSKYLQIPVYNNVAEINVEKDYSAENIQSLGTRRNGQQKFSKKIKENYDFRCAICGIREPEFLIAGHISRWTDDYQNRLNPGNGICFCSLHDKAFEHGYIGVTDDFEIVLNSKIDPNSVLYNQLKGLAGKKIILPKINLPDTEFLKIHRAKHKLGEYGI